MRAVRQHTVRHTRTWLGTIAGLAIFVISPGEWPLLTRLLVAWNGGALLFLTLVYIWMIRLDADRIHARYREGDATAPVLLLVITIAALASLVAIVALLATVKNVSAAQRILHVSLATTTVVVSWVIVATMFTLHYANLYYSAKVDNPPLRFPETAQPLKRSSPLCSTSPSLVSPSMFRRVCSSGRLAEWRGRCAVHRQLLSDSRAE
jgi:uncharacterized membrane protein